MSKKRPTNIAESIRQRLLNLARSRKEDFQLILVRYACERVLYRLRQLPDTEGYVLKGALLFELWTGQPHRATRDVDMLGHGVSEIGALEGIFQAALALDVEPDGLTFPTDKIRGEEIREDQSYSGIRIHAEAQLDKIRIPLHIDIGFGDAVTPEAEPVTYPSLLGLPTANILAYPRETVVAEKFEAMVSLGLANSRMKDFYDIWVLAQQFEFDANALSKAIQATFARRATKIPKQPPVALTSDFSLDQSKAKQWAAFVSRARLLTEPAAFVDVVGRIAEFIWPAVEGAPGTTWPAGGPWR